jgi:hypothetical protein
MKRKPGLGETVQVKDKVAVALSFGLAERIGRVVSTTCAPGSHCDVIVEFRAHSGYEFHVAMKTKELKRVK